MKTVGIALVEMLEHLGTEIVFGIPGVHTVELYRGLAHTKIRHVTPRHEQGAGFMADGYARISGKPGVCFLITGPGLTNAITAMAQALQDSIPMLVITGVNPKSKTEDRGGRLHELPDQHALVGALTPHTYSLRSAADLPVALTQAFQMFSSARPGPAHIEIPIDLMSAPMPEFVMPSPETLPPTPNPSEIQRAVKMIDAASRPLVLAGGGCRRAGHEVRAFAHKIDAPIVSTANARAAIGRDPLHVSASASHPNIRSQIAAADLVIGLGTEVGQTDYDVYLDGAFPHMKRFIRVDIDAGRLSQNPPCDVALQGTVSNVVKELTDSIRKKDPTDAPERAQDMIRSVEPPVGTEMSADLDIVDTLVDLLPDSPIVGDSTQLVYSGNLLHRTRVPQGWFNSATGYGTLGYGLPAAIGAALARPGAPIICLTGDGGLQFSLSELGAAADEGVQVICLVWNNRGYKEIETYMHNIEMEPIGVTPAPPKFDQIAAAFGLPYFQVRTLAEMAAALPKCASAKGTVILECIAPNSQSAVMGWTKPERT